MKSPLRSLKEWLDEQHPIKIRALGFSLIVISCCGSPFWLAIPLQEGPHGPNGAITGPPNGPQMFFGGMCGTVIFFILGILLIRSAKPPR